MWTVRLQGDQDQGFYARGGAGHPRDLIAMYYAFYNFARVHQTLKTTPSGLLLRLLLRPQWLGGSLWQP